MIIAEHEALLFCPKCGQNIERKSQGLLLCDSCEYRFYLSPKPGVKGIVIASDGRLVMTRRNIEPYIGKLDLLGGFVEPLESFEEGLLREISEELGLPHIEVQETKYLQSIGKPYIYQNIVYSAVITIFSVQLKNIPDLQNFDRKEIQEAFLVHPQDLNLEEVGFETHREILKDFIHSS